VTLQQQQQQQAAATTISGAWKYFQRQVWRLRFKSHVESNLFDYWKQM